ncbi:MAG: acyl--CoA ligase [Acidimicrobiaceae bacterium]|nr:acyl--CoA ligase [Acidimicrobiaceae bacterium]
MTDALALGVDAERLTLAAYVEDIAGRFADREAMVFEGDHLTYADLLARSRALAKSLIAAGVSKGTKVAILVASRPEFVVASFATSLAGGVIVPVSTLATREEREHILCHSDSAVLVTQHHLRRHEYVADLAGHHPSLLSGCPGRLADPAFPFLRRVVVLGDTSGTAEGWDEFLALGSDVPDSLLDAAARQVTPADDGIIIYTSGTTAVPKAVLHAHRSVTVQMWRWAQLLELESSDRVWSAYPFFWTAGFAMYIGGTLSSGATLVMQEVFDAAGALELIERERATTVMAFEHTAAQLANHPDAHRRDLSSLRNLGKSSSLRAIIGPGDHWDPQAGYGSSETFTVSCALPSRTPDHIRSHTHGPPLPGMEVRIVDPDTGEPLPTGQTGEIVVRGISLMRGYYKLPLEDAFDGGGWFHSNDAGYLNEQGFLHWSGRISGLIKTAGANVSPVEVENRAAGLKMLGVTCAVGIPHPTLGEAVVLAGIPLEDVKYEEDRFLAYLREHLASYKVPKRVLLFSEGELDFTSSDKVRTDQARRLIIERLIATDTDKDWVRYLRSLSGR